MCGLWHRTRKLFEACDTDSSGSLHADEFLQLMTALIPSLEMEDVKRSFRMVGATESIDVQQFTVWCSRLFGDFEASHFEDQIHQLLSNKHNRAVIDAAFDDMSPKPPQSAAHAILERKGRNRSSGSAGGTHQMHAVLAVERQANLEEAWSTRSEGWQRADSKNEGSQSVGRQSAGRRRSPAPAPGGGRPPAARTCSPCTRSKSFSEGDIPEQQQEQEQEQEQQLVRQQSDAQRRAW